MPNSMVQSFAKKTGKSVDRVEHLWDKAKKIATDAGRTDDYAYITGVLKKMLGLKESLSDEVIKIFEDTKIAGWKNGRPQLKNKDGKLVDYTDITDDDPESSKPESENPTQAQKDAGNYKKYHMKMNSWDISIENPVGSTRSGIDKDGKKWSTKMNHHYGYLKGTEGKDKDHIDCFINPEILDSKGIKLEFDKDNDVGTIDTEVYVINQVNPTTDKFDEHKCMLGFNDEKEAKEAYLSNYEKGWKGLGSIKTMSVTDFSDWAFSGKKSKPAESLSDKVIKIFEDTK